MGVLIFLGVGAASAAAYLAILAGFLLVGLWAAGEAEKLFGTKDASPIVIDEIAGMLLTYALLPVAYLPVLLGFVFFRVFDIVKPFPQLEDLPGGWGIMADDLCAGLLAHGCLRLSIWFFNV